MVASRSRAPPPCGWPLDATWRESDMMHPKSTRCPRRAAMAVEAAVVYPVVMLLFAALVLGGVAVFRYEQVACQAREAARLASVRGVNWQVETNQSSPTKQQILQLAVLPLAAGMDPAKISIEIKWIDQAAGTSADWDSAGKDVRS